MPTITQSQANRARIVLSAIVVPIFAATIAGLIALWPGKSGPAGSLPDPFADAPLQTVTVTAATGESDEFGTHVTAELPDGGEVAVHVPPEIMEFGLEAGSTIRVFLPGLDDGAAEYVFVDFVRGPPMILLAAVFLVVVALVARVRGLLAVVGLVGAGAIVLYFLIPALMAGAPPVATTLVAASAMMFLAIYLAHGISIRTTTALIGTFAGLVVTTLLAVWAVDGTHLTGAGSDAAAMVTTMLPELSFRHILMGGMILAGLGALNDVTITQASAVWELYDSDPRQGPRALFAKGMRIGRDHIASTVYTIAMAYIGVALPLALVIMMYDRPLTAVLTASDIAEELVRTLVSSIGLVLAIPATTALAVLLVSVTAPRGRHRRRGRGNGEALSRM